MAGTLYPAKWAFVFSMTVEERVSSSLSTSIQSEKWHTVTKYLCFSSSQRSWLTIWQGPVGIGKDFTGSFGAESAILGASTTRITHTLDGLSHSWPKEDFTCQPRWWRIEHTYSVDIAKHVLLHRLRYYDLVAFVNNAILHWQFVAIIPVGAQRLGDVCSVCWPPVNNDFV